MHIDSIFHEASIYNVFTKRWQTADVAVHEGTILYLGDASTAGLTADEHIVCAGRPLIPGFIDIHLHIESSLCTPEVFAREVLTRGVTSVVSEPHEIANVFGIEGIAAMIEASEHTPVDIFYGIPSSVPSTDESLETTGGRIDGGELVELIERYPKVVCLGEVMNYRQIISDTLQQQQGEDRSVQLIKTMQQLRPLHRIEGHCPSVRGLELSCLLYSGVGSDHCLQDPEGMLQRFEQGMFVELQEKSISEEIIEVLKDRRYDGLYSFVTDDVPPDILSTQGHVDHIIRKAMSLGLTLEQAVIASSYAPAVRMGLSDRGAVAPGRKADLLLLADRSSDLTIEAVYKEGTLSSDILVPKKRSNDYFSGCHESLRVSPELSISEALTIPCTAAGIQRCTVMHKNSSNTYTEAIIQELESDGSRLCWEDRDLDLAVVVCRYREEHRYGQGLVAGDILRGGAFCTSHAHDHHNILILGDDPKDMRIAYEQVLKTSGGMCVVSGGKILADLALPIGGIITDAPFEELSADVTAVQQALRSLGIEHSNPIMSMCTLTLPVSPELKLTDRGLVRTEDTTLIPLILPES